MDSHRGGAAQARQMRMWNVAQWAREECDTTAVHLVANLRLSSQVGDANTAQQYFRNALCKLCWLLDLVGGQCHCVPSVGLLAQHHGSNCGGTQMR